jgi:AcrR family transcriptional regulator
MAISAQDQDEKALDPRIRRTRQMLREALLSLLAVKSFDSISIQDIAQQATVNRATFYAHYVDRAALLEDVVHSRFQELLEVRQVHFEGTCPSALRIVVLAVYDFLRELRSGCSEHRRHFEPFVQSVVQKQVEQVLVIGLEKGAFSPGYTPSLVAATLSWAIYGAATASLRSETPVKPEIFVNEVYALLLPILIPDSAARAQAEAYAH